MSDIYYSPENYGLKIFGELSDGSLAYEYDMFVVWENAKGELFYDTDSGCSCPSPFENSSLKTLNAITNADEFERTVKTWNHDTYADRTKDPGELDLVTKVRDHLRKLNA